ncbi:hypothetical protein [Salmonella enterica]|uniref:hypothetical protein n=1 Tax=Salmonella enterica TaxID=28901 RepID=UPI001F0AE0B2|nr:hypothetical protein [Salmonella enterica]
MSNNKLTDRKIAEILVRAEICDDSVLTDYADIAAAMRELQERRRLDGILYAVCEVCGVLCNNPNHPQMAVAHEYSAQPVPIVSFYRDGIEASASWVDKQRQAFDNEHGRYDSDTGAFEFGNDDAQRDYSDTLAELADGIRGLHPNAGDNSPVTPDGWKLAPEKADEDMIAEGSIMASCMIDTVGKIDVSLIYGAMLAAAQKKETGPCTK